MQQMKHHELFWYPDTYEVARGLVLGGHSFIVVGVGGVVRREVPSLLGPFGLPGWDGLPFLVPLGLGEGISSSSSSLSLEECASVSSDDESDTTLHRRPFLVPVAFFLAFFSGTS